MDTTRRKFIGTAMGVGAAATLAAGAGPQPASAAAGRSIRLASARAGVWVDHFGVEPNTERDHTPGFQAAVDRAAQLGTPLLLPAGRFQLTSLRLRPRTTLIGVGLGTELHFTEPGDGMVIEQADQIRIEHLTIHGGDTPTGGRGGAALIAARDVTRVNLESVVLRNSAGNGIALERCGGRISNCLVESAALTGIKSLDAIGLEISQNEVTNCGNNGIQVWRSKPGEDGTIVSQNRIHKIKARAGGDGQNGNAINVFRAGSVLVQANRISDCAFSAVRGNAASNIQIIGNNCSRLGEVALYSEFGYQGALIAQNLVDTAATGISITNFNEGGRLAIAQGNLIRNLFRRNHVEDIRGTGIGVEADCVVQGNVIENAPTTGIAIGWGSYMRNVAASGNVIRACEIGIGISSAANTGPVSVNNNIISDVKNGAIRAMDHNTPEGPDLAKRKLSQWQSVALSGNVVSST